MFINHFFECNFCKVENKIKIEEDDRGQIQMKKGEELPYTCISCHKKDKIHVNKIYAEPSKIIYIIALIISLLSVIIFWDLGFIISLSFTFPFSIYLYQQNLARIFNNYRIKR